MAGFHGPIYSVGGLIRGDVAVGLGAALLLAPPIGGAAAGIALPASGALVFIAGLEASAGAVEVFVTAAFEVLVFSLPQPMEREAAASKVRRAGTLRINISWP